MFRHVYHVRTEYSEFAQKVLAISFLNFKNVFSFDESYHHHQSELVGDVAVPVSVRQVVLFCAHLPSPDARPRLNWRRSSSTVLSQV